jgi:hypothetical protein
MRKVLFFCFLFSLLSLRISFADVIELKLTVTNPSTDETRTIPVKTYLPKGAKPDDVINKGDFSIAYDFEKSLYYAYQNISLQPKEAIDLTIGIRDIWVISDEEINSLKDHTAKIVSILQKTEFASRAKQMGEDITAHFEKILDNQNENPPMEQRMLNYEENLSMFSAQRDAIGELEEMAIQTGTLGEAQVKQLMGGSPENLQNKAALETLIIRMSVENPIDEERTVPFKYYLPAEVKPEFITDSGGLEAGYDYQKNVYYLFNTSVVFAAKESKDFAIQIKDLWSINPEKLDAAGTRAKKLVDRLAATEYQELAAVLGEKILAVLKDITTTQGNKEESIENHIGVYRDNVKKFEEAIKDITKLERLLVQSGGSKAQAMVDNKAPKAEGRGFKTQGSLTKGSIKGVEIFHRNNLKGKAPDVALTWKIIWFIIGFLGFLSLMFFMLWWQEVRSNQGKTYRYVQSDHTEPKTNAY